MQQIGRGASSTAPAKPDGHTKDLAGRNRTAIQKTIRDAAGRRGTGVPTNLIDV